MLISCWFIVILSSPTAIKRPIQPFASGGMCWIFSKPMVQNTLQLTGPLFELVIPQLLINTRDINHVLASLMHLKHHFQELLVHRGTE